MDDADVDILCAAELDTGIILIERIVLELPLKALCTEDCRGLCPVCGINLNEKQCSCHKEDTLDSRFAKLKDFKVN